MPSLPLSTPMAIALYFTIWWVVLFVTLPFGVLSQHEEPEMAPGTDPGAPVAPNLLAKALWTTAISAVVFCLAIAAIIYGPDLTRS